MRDFTIILGLAAAGFTSLSYLPQLKKALPRNSTGDLSLKMLYALTGGLCLWIIYGILTGDAVIIIANSVGMSLTGTVLLCKLRDVWWGRSDR